MWSRLVRMSVVMDYIYADVYQFDKNVYVANDEVIIGSSIEVNDSLVLKNNGFINVDKITICDECSLEIVNSGIIDAEFVLGKWATIVQVVSETEHINKIDFKETAFSLNVVNAENIRFSDILNIAKQADVINVYNSKIIVDVQDVDKNKIKFHDKVFLYIENNDLLTDKPIFSDIDNDVRIFVESDLNNPLMTLKTYVYENDLYVNLIRETDYAKIYKNDLGIFLNSLRNDANADSFLYAIDAVNSENDLYKIMAESMRIAPINMMKTIAVYNVFDMNNFLSDVGVRVDYINFDVSDVYSLILNLNMKVENLEFGVGGYFNIFEETDGLDHVYGKTLGGNVTAKYSFNDYFVRGKIGANFSWFDMENVFDGHDSIDNPIGWSLYGAFDIGCKYDGVYALYIMPYVGGTVNYMSVSYQKENQIAGRMGTEIGYSMEMLGVVYDYAVHLSIDTVADVMFGTSVSFMSNLDKVGGRVSFDYMNSEIGHGYKIAAGLNFMF